MSFDAESLLRLLPAIHRIRDAERAAASAGESRGPLESLLTVFAEQIAVLEENLEQLYDDLFIETCADWVVPYIGDLIGYQALHGVVPRVASPRAEVAHTIALRRRKGTALVLEQLARDVTGWNARAVEFFQRLATTQHVNHPRLHSLRCPDVRDAEAMEWIGTAFEGASRSVDVRHIESGRGRHNIPNVGLFLWRIADQRRGSGGRTPDGRARGTPAVRVEAGRYRISPLNHDVPLYSHPRREDDITHLAEPANVPLPLSRRRLARHLDEYYGMPSGAEEETATREPSLVLWLGDTAIERDRIRVCNLSGEGADWAHTPPPPGRYAVDPELGRIALPPEVPDPANVRVTWYEGFGAELGGGEYERGASLPTTEEDVEQIPRVPPSPDDLRDALASLGGNGVVEISDSGRYELTESLAIQVAEGAHIEIRAANRCRPAVVLSEPLTVVGGDGSAFTLNGLLVGGAGLRVKGDGENLLAELHLRHCTLVPGLALEPDGRPTQPDEPSLVVEIPDLEVAIDRSILGGVRLHDRSSLTATDSILDATHRAGVAFAAPEDAGDEAGPEGEAPGGSDETSPGGRLSLESCTVVGRVHARELGEVSNSLLLAEARGSAPVRATRTQVGCVRFSFLPYASVVPRRHRCQPDSEEAARRIAPAFTSLRFGTPAYCQLRATTPEAIRRGAEDESEMGAFRHLYAPQREANLSIRLGEYLRVGLRAGIFYES